MIAEACVIAHLWHLQQGGRYLRQRGSPDNLTHFNPYTYADIDTIADHLHFPGGNPYLDIEEHGALGGGHAHAGLMIYQGGAWPESYGDYALINNIHGAQINMDELLPKGSGFVGAHRPSFIKFNDPWSQIVNLQYDHDGAVYMIDWYDQEQCHVEDPGIPDRGNGRIFKLSYGDTPATDIDMQSRSDASCSPTCWNAGNGASGTPGVYCRNAQRPESSMPACRKRCARSWDSAGLHRSCR